MPVFFAYRSFDLAPTGRYLKRFEDDTVLDWFLRHWDDLAIEDGEESDKQFAEVLGCDGWFLWNPFRTAVEEGLPPPKSERALHALIRRCVDDDNFRGSPHAIQVFTEEDGEGGALYYFDGHFLKRSAGLASYLLLEGWQLPAGAGNGGFVPTAPTRTLRPGGTGDGTTYIVLLERESKYPLDDLAPGYRIEGIRLPELAQHLCCLRADAKDSDYHWCARLRQLPALMFAGLEASDPVETAFIRAAQAVPHDGGCWAAWSDWRQERNLNSPGIDLLVRALERFGRFPGKFQDRLPKDADLGLSCRSLLELEDRHRGELRFSSKNLGALDDHIVQACVDGSWTDDPYYGQWYFFDDVWASAHPDLANALLRFSAKWDVLSPD